MTSHRIAGERYYVVPVLLKAVAILELLRSSEVALRVDDIHKATGFARSTVYRILRSFIMGEYLTEVAPGQYAFKQDPRSPPIAERTRSKADLSTEVKQMPEPEGVVVLAHLGRQGSSRSRNTVV